MKQTKEYKAPALELIKLDTADVVTVSSGDTLVDANAYFSSGQKWGSIYDMLF